MPKIVFLGVLAILGASVPLWQTTVGGPYDHVYPSVVLASDAVFGASQSSIAAFDIATGAIRWRHRAFGSPFFLNHDGVVASSSVGIGYLSRRSGAAHWSLKVCGGRRPIGIAADDAVAAVMCAAPGALVRIIFVDLRKAKVSATVSTQMQYWQGLIKVVKIGPHRFGLANVGPGFVQFTDSVDLVNERRVETTPEEDRRIIYAPTFGCTPPTPQPIIEGKYRIVVCDHGPVDIKVYRDKP